MKPGKPSQERTKSKGKVSRGANNQRPAELKTEPPQPQPAPAAVTPMPQDHCRRPDRPQLWTERKRLYLRVGDEVNHMRHEEWGIGVVMEIMTSSVPGGTCLARVRFQDGQLRCFNNDLDNESCCYYFGVRRYWNPSRGNDVLRARFLALKG